MSRGNQSAGRVTDEQIRRVSKSQKNNILAAERLGIHVSTYRRRKKALGIPPSPRQASALEREIGGSKLRKRGFVKRDWGASSRYFNACATAGCTGMPLANGICIRCATAALKKERTV
mgnify:FL=1